jgi:hypothetical protein
MQRGLYAHFQVRKPYRPPKMKAVYLPETFINSYQARQRHIAEDGKLYSHSVFIVRENVSQTEKIKLRRMRQLRFAYGES